MTPPVLDSSIMVASSDYNSAREKTKNSDWNTIKTLVPYLWPTKDWNIKTRVLAALVCLALAKIATVSVPVFYKDAVDLISLDQNFVISALLLSILYSFHLLLGK